MRSPRCGRLACGPVYFSPLPGTTRGRSAYLAGCVNKLTDRPVCIGYTIGHANPTVRRRLGEPREIPRRRGGRAESRRGGRGGRRRISERRAAAAEDPVRRARVPSPDGRAVRDASAEPELPEVGSQPKYAGSPAGRVEAARSGVQPRPARGAASRRAGACSRSWASTTPTAAAPTSRRSSRSSTRAPTSSWRASRASSRGRRILPALRAQALGGSSPRRTTARRRRRTTTPTKMAAAYATVRRRAARGAAQGAASAGARETESDGVAAGPREFAPVRRDARKHIVHKRNVRPGRRRPARLGVPAEHRVRAARRRSGRTTRARSSSKARRTRARASRSRRCSSTCSSGRDDEASRGHLGVHALQHGAALRRVGREDENEDSGSSLRGALKGWAKHGASSERLVDDAAHAAAPAMYPAEDWWLDAVKRPIGAYYRIAPENVRDMHVALKEVGAVYASALTHEGWDDAAARKRTPTAEGSRRDCPSSRRRAAPPIKATRSRSSATRATGSSSRTRGATTWGARRLRRAAVRRLAAQRDGLLGRAARRRDRRARSRVAGAVAARRAARGPRRRRRLEQRDAGRSRGLAVRHQHGERGAVEPARPLPHQRRRS